MKALTAVGVILGVLLTFGVASALDASKIPAHMQAQYAATTGSEQNFAIWFPVVPQLSTRSWSNILIVSNFNEFPITVQCWFTSFAEEQTAKTYTLDFFQKKIVILGSSGFGDDLYDIYCGCDQLFGAAVLLLEGGDIVTAWPHFFFF